VTKKKDEDNDFVEIGGAAQGEKQLEKKED
jgi:hypothetical protein